MSKALHDCYCEMYAKSTPSGDWAQMVQDAQDGKIAKDEKVYERHYLSEEDYKEIVDKYLDAYRVKSEWRDDVGVVEDFLANGGSEEVYDDETNQKEYVKIPTLKEDLSKIVDEGLVDEVYDCVMRKIDKCKNHYRFNSEESAFRFEVALGPSPTSNKQTVIDYWKEKGIDVEL